MQGNDSIFSAQSLTRLAQGAAGGAVLAMVLGFGFGFWTLVSTAQQQKADAVEQAYVTAYAPVCVQRFTAAPAAQHAEFAKTESWQRDTYLAKAGFATPQGLKDPIRAVASACADTLNEQLKKGAEAKQAKQS